MPKLVKDPKKLRKLHEAVNRTMLKLYRFVNSSGDENWQSVYAQRLQLSNTVARIAASWIEENKQLLASDAQPSNSDCTSKS